MKRLCSCPAAEPGLYSCALAGLSITLLAMIVALIPPPGTSNVWIHEAKLGAVRSS